MMFFWFAQEKPQQLGVWTINRFTTFHTWDMPELCPWAGDTLMICSCLSVLFFFNCLWLVVISPSVSMFVVSTPGLLPCYAFFQILCMFLSVTLQLFRRMRIVMANRIVPTCGWLMKLEEFEAQTKWNINEKWEGMLLVNLSHRHGMAPECRQCI